MLQGADELLPISLPAIPQAAGGECEAACGSTTAATGFRGAEGGEGVGGGRDGPPPRK